LHTPLFVDFLKLHLGEVVTDSYKYGSEVQFVHFSRKAPELKARVDKEHGYYRLECGYLLGTQERAQKLEMLQTN